MRWDFHSIPLTSSAPKNGGCWYVYTRIKAKHFRCKPLCKKSASWMSAFSWSDQERLNCGVGKHSRDTMTNYNESHSMFIQGAAIRWFKDRTLWGGYGGHMTIDMGTKPLHFLLDSKEKYQSRTDSLPTKLGQQPTSKTTSSEKTLGSAVDRSAVNVKTKQNKLGVLICQKMKCSHNKKDWLPKLRDQNHAV